MNNGYSDLYASSLLRFARGTCTRKATVHTSVTRSNAVQFVDVGKTLLRNRTFIFGSILCRSLTSNDKLDVDKIDKYVRKINYSVYVFIMLVLNFDS